MAYCIELLVVFCSIQVKKKNYLSFLINRIKYRNIAKLFEKDSVTSSDTKNDRKNPLPLLHLQKVTS